MSRPPFNRTTQRLREIERVIVQRHGIVPATDDADVYLVPLAQCYRQLLIKARLPATVADIVDRLTVSKVVHGSGIVYRQMRDAAIEAIDQPNLENADDIARRLNVDYDEREELNLRSIGATDADKRERARRRKDRNRKRAKERSARLRSERGAVPREEYLATHSVSRTKPWEALGISKATYYRRRGATAAKPATEPVRQVGFPLKPRVRIGKPTCLTPEPAARPARRLPMKRGPSIPATHLRVFGELVEMRS
jgi:ElaB/YqjD/DUF883 family membrane-anchored ribosome-binding protein